MKQEKFSWQKATAIVVVCFLVGVCISPYWGCG